MPIDSSIALGVQSPKIDSPLNALAQVLQIRHLQGQGDMADFQMQQARRGVDEQNALRRLLSSDGFDISSPQSQRQVMGISPTAGQALIKGNLDMRKTGAELDEKTFKTANERYGVVQKSLGSLYQDPNLTKDMVVQNGMQLVQAGLITPQMHQQTIAQLPDDPGQLRQFLAQRLKTQLTPEQIVTAFAPKPTQVDSGASISFQDTNPNSPTYGKPTGPAPVQKQQTPDARARLAQDQQNANQGVTYQQLEDGSFAALPTKLAPGATPVARTAMGPDGRPVVGGGKPLTDAQAKAALFGTRMQEANKIFDALEKTGTTTSIPGSRAGMGVGPIINALSPADQQQLDQAKRDFINAVLRRESGAVIAESEFKNAEQQYFPQIGDTPKVIAQKKQNREIAQRGIMAEVPQGKRASLTAEITGQPQSGAFSDPAKESRYQQWKASQGK